jgi:K+-sensing histidine kinase KdpD
MKYLENGGSAPDHGAALNIARGKGINWPGYAVGALASTLTAALAWVLYDHSQLADVVMLYLLGIVVVALLVGRGPSLLAAALSVLAYDYFFIPPIYTFNVADGRHFVTFAVMLLVAFVISSLAQRVRDQAALAVENANERANLAEEAERRRLQAETEMLRSSLLSSISHDLRTPLAVMTGAASTLLSDEALLVRAQARSLLQGIEREGERLNRLIRNVLDMTRLESGAVRVKPEWHSIEEIVGAALNRSEALLNGHVVWVDQETDVMVPIDDVLVEQAIVNLLENAAKYAVRSEPQEVVIDVSDRGAGLAPGEEELIFDKFQRGRAAGESSGAGLGLAIARGIAVAHGGSLSAKNREGGGAQFSLALPVRGDAPSMTPPESRMAIGAARSPKGF